MHHIALIWMCATVHLVISGHVTAAENPVIPIKGVLSSFKTNAGSVLSPILINEIVKLYLNRTAENQELNTASKSSRLKSTRMDPIFPETPKIELPKITTLRPTNIENVQNKQDSDRASQTQLESQFPFDFRNDFRGFSGPGSLHGIEGRQSDQRLFPDIERLNSAISQPYTSFLNGAAGAENDIQRSRLNSQGEIYRGINRPLILPESSRDFGGRFQDYGRAELDGRLSSFNRFQQGVRFGGDNPNEFLNYVGQQAQSGFIPQNYAQDSLNFLPSRRLQNSHANVFGNNQQQVDNDFPVLFPTSDTEDTRVRGIPPTDTGSQRNGNAAPRSFGSRRNGDYKAKTEIVTDSTDAASKK